MQGGHVNPFKMPTDADVFILRDEEKRQRDIERRRNANLSAHERTTRSARMMGATRTSTLAMDDDEDEEDDHAATMPGSTVTLPAINKRVKDNMTSYITKKRKLGLERMSLATKRQEIKKLDEEAEHSEKRIEQMAEQLKETEGKFNAFLEQTELEHKKAHNKAEYESKQKQEKVQNIKRLATSIAQLETDCRKIEEQLQQCLDFKEFLDQLANVDWMAATLIELRQEDKRNEIAMKLERKYNDTMPEATTDAEEAERQEKKKAELEKLCADEFKAIETEIRDLDPNRKETYLRKALDAYDPDRVPMYFTRPEQIIQKFVDIEEGNLSLITTCQEYEEEIERITAEYNQKKLEMAETAKTKHAQMEALRKQIAAEHAKAKALEERIGRTAGQKTQDNLRDLISAKIKQIYESLGIGDDAANAGTLGSLTSIEVKLDDMRQAIMAIEDREFVTKKMKQRDKERRQEARQVLLSHHKELRERRSRDALARAQAPVKKRVGKPVMWRSHPQDHKKQEVVTAEETNANDEDEFFA